MSRLSKFLREPLRRKVLLAEAFLHLCRAWFIVRQIGFEKRARHFGDRQPGDWSIGSPQNIDTIRDVRWAINKVNRGFGERFTCLMVGIAGKGMLRRFGIPNALVLGAMKSPDPDKLGMRAHAWLRCGDMVVLGGEGMKPYQPIQSYVDETFGKQKGPRKILRSP